jgi:hypothetical protein
MKKRLTKKQERILDKMVATTVAHLEAMPEAERKTRLAAMRKLMKAK